MLNTIDGNGKCGFPKCGFYRFEMGNVYIFPILTFNHGFLQNLPVYVEFIKHLTPNFLKNLASMSS